MKKFISLALFGLLMVGTTGCSNNKQISEPVEEVQQVLSIRKLNSGVDSNDHSFVKFNYSISPSNASDRSVITTLSWVNQNVQDTISNYLTVLADESDYSITVTCLQSFSNQVNLNVRSAHNSECYVDIPIDYEVRLEDFDFTELEKTASYQLNGSTVQPWWNGTAYSISVNNDSSISVDCTQYRDYGNISSTVKIFSFPFSQYIARAAKYSVGTVDNVSETLNVSYTLGSCSLTAYGSVSTQWPSKVMELFDEDILPNIAEYGYMTVGNFDSYVSSWAFDNLTAAEASDIYNNMFSLIFDLDVEFSGSNGVTSTKEISFQYMISGRFFDIPVRSLSTESVSYTF